jgi:hypothetical protein
LDNDCILPILYLGSNIIGSFGEGYWHHSLSVWEEVYELYNFTGPEGLEPSTYCSAGSHSIQTELWTLLKEMIFRYMNFPFLLCGIMRFTVPEHFL